MTLSSNKVSSKTNYLSSSLSRTLNSKINLDNLNNNIDLDNILSA